MDAGTASNSKAGPEAGPETDGLAIRPEATRAIVLTWPDHALTWEGAAWLYHLLPPENIIGFCGRNLVVARNAVVKELCLKAPPEITDFILMDRDMRPGQAALPMLQAEGDVVGCTYPIPHMAGWADPAMIHLGLVRIRRKVFEALQPPWFLFGYTEDGAGLGLCECGYFRDKVLEAGFTVTRAGWCDHDRKR